MKNLIISLFTLTALCASLLAEEPVKILGIGNSFTMDAMEQHLQPIMTAMNQPCILGYPYRGGTSLQQHDTWKNRTDTLVYNYCEFRNGIFTKTGPNSSNLISKVQLEPWDYVLIQTDHLNSGKIASYEPYLTHLIQFVKDNCSNKSVKIGLYMTWGYDSGSTASGFNYYQKSSKVMYDSIVSCVQRILPNHPELFLIPVGTAIQNGRTSYKGEHFNRDGYHLNYEYGRYIASLCWAKAICGFEPDSVTYQPSSITDYCANMCRQAVKNAFIQPYDTISLRAQYGKSDEENQPGDESRLRRVTFNGLNIPVIEGKYDYIVNINTALGTTVEMWSYAISTKAEQNIVDEKGSDIPRDPERYGYFPLDAPKLGDTVTYVNRVISEDGQHTTTYTFHLVGVTEADMLYTIASLDDLKNFATAVNKGQYGLNAIVTQDVDLGLQKIDCWMTPIGTKEHPYTGTFDGLGHTLSSFCIYVKSGSNESLYQQTALGLFGAIQGATVKNLNLTTMEEMRLDAPPSSVTSTITSFGALVGQMSASTISHCCVNAEFNTSISNAIPSGVGCPTGAICGRTVGGNGASKIEYCRVGGTWNARAVNYFGGFVGWADDLTIENSSSHVTMSLLTNVSTHLGGFIGVAKSEATDRFIRLKNCYFAGSITDDRASHGTSTSYTAYLGALYAYVYSPRVELDNCHWLENSAPKVNSRIRSGATNPTATTFNAAALTDGRLVAQLGEAFVQGPSFPVFKGEISVNDDPAVRGKIYLYKTVAEIGAALQWDKGTIHNSFDLNDDIHWTSISDNGTYYSLLTVRVYESRNDSGATTISANNNCWIESIAFNYTPINNVGVLSLAKDTAQGVVPANPNDKIASDSLSSVDGQSFSFYSGRTSSSANNGRCDIAAFTVIYYQLPSQITLPDTLETTIGQTIQVGQVTPADAYHVWSSSDEAVAKVDQTGLLTVLSEGETIVYVTSKNDIEQTCVIKVKGLPTGLDENQSASSFNIHNSKFIRNGHLYIQNGDAIYTPQGLRLR